MSVLTYLESLGYQVELKGNDIRLSYQGAGKPDPEQVRPLLRELRDHKPEAIRELQKGNGRPQPVLKWEEKGRLIWREKGELTIKANRLGGQVVRLVAGADRYNPDSNLPQFILPDDLELIEALDKVMRVFPGTNLVKVRRDN